MNIIKELRQRKGITQEELGKILNVQKATISKYERGHIIPDVPTMLKLSEFFGVTIYYLLGLPENNTLNKSKDIILSEDERCLIEKYRKLPLDRKETVKLILDNQVNAVIQSEEKKLRNA